MPHIHRKLKSILPALFLQPQQNEVPLAQTAAMLGQTVMAGFEAMRAERALERETATALPSFTKSFPANAATLRRLCQVVEDDQLPEFWRFLAANKGSKKSVGLSAFINYTTLRANQDDSSGILPIISASLYNNISSFELGANDLETITQGVSPFLMCPIGYVKVKHVTMVTQQFMTIHCGEGTPQLSDLKSLAPNNDYSIPSDCHSLADFIGAYSIVWDVLLGPQHPLARSIRDHFKYWRRNVSTVIRAIPETVFQRIVIIGTLRFIQLDVMDYVKQAMFGDINTPVPDFVQITQAIKHRLFQNFPGLPGEYNEPLPLPPNPTGVPIPPGSPPIGTQVFAPHGERHQQFRAMFEKGDKSIQALKLLSDLPKEKNGRGTLCLSYHLKGQCFESCRRASSHRKLDKKEIENMQAFLDKNI
jgi:hypothetical protein